MDDFATYVRNLLSNTNPQGDMLTGDAAAYRADPFRMQNSLDAALAKKTAEEEALKLLQSQGLLQPQSSGGSVEMGPASTPGHTPSQQMVSQANMLSNLGAQISKVSPIMGGLLSAAGYLGMNSAMNAAGQEQDSFSAALDAVANGPAGMGVATGANGMSYTYSSPATIAAADAAMFGGTTVNPDGSMSFSGPAYGGLSAADAAAGLSGLGMGEGSTGSIGD